MEINRVGTAKEDDDFRCSALTLREYRTEEGDKCDEPEFQRYGDISLGEL